MISNLDYFLKNVKIFLLMFNTIVKLNKWNLIENFYQHDLPK